MGCKGSKHTLHGGGGGAWAPEPRTCSGLVGRHSVALRSSTLGTLSFDRAAAAAAAAGVSFGGGDEGMIKAGNDGGGSGKYGPSCSFGGWRPGTPPVMAPAKRQRRVVLKVAPRTPTKTPMREPEEINVWELMEGLEDEEGDEDAEEDGHSVERQVKSAPGSPVFDPVILDAFRKALDELSPDSPPRDVVARKGGDVEKVEIQMFPGIVRSRVNVFQEKINAKLAKKAPPQPRPLPPPPDSTRRVVVYLTSLRGIRQTYEDCWSTSAILRGYGVHVDERDLSMHAGYKEELRAALGGGAHYALPQVFADGRLLGGAEEIRRMHETGELASVLETCEMAPRAKGDAAREACGGCGGARFVPCDACSGSCKVFVVDESAGAGAGAFRRCPECNENGLVRCPVC
ncbi:uncharacterized protein At3g28850-like [Phragmites australis]|uniref:uncharacterized protein At3g28850-like n=1 Tax=Phragmites australis TaxID=29695 RepID=UPI002D7822EC|nr:uncharacterized protein At3g28850-like [Phragmites australis]